MIIKEMKRNENGKENENEKKQKKRKKKTTTNYKNIFNMIRIIFYSFIHSLFQP